VARCLRITRRSPKSWKIPSLIGIRLVENIIDSLKENTMKIEAVAITFPGQTEFVRVREGRTAWVVEHELNLPRSVSVQYGDVVTGEELSPEEFLTKYPPLAGGVVEREAVLRGLWKAKG
jgi:hypothetical protein